MRLHVVLASLAMATAPASAPVLAAGACTDTAIVRIEPRLQGAPGSGVFVAYADGVSQVSYRVLPPVQRSRAGDPVRLCVQSRPAGCPKGDTRGAVYSAFNRRTGETWSAADSSHLCGGA